MAYYRFDDFNLAGRQSVAGVGVNPDDIEYYLYAADSYVGSLMDWKTEWANAAIVVGGDLSSSGSFVSEITGLEVDVEAYSGGTELDPKVAYVDPADSANDDVVKAVIVTEAYEADGGDISYLYFWLKTDEDGMADDGLTCNGTDLLDAYDKVLDVDTVLGRAAEINLADTGLVPGDYLQLVVVPISSLGTVGQPEFSSVVTIAEPTGEEGLPAELVLTAINGKTDIKDQTGIAAGKALSVKVYNPNEAGKVHIQWFCNYLPVESKEVAIGKESSATLKLTNTSKVKEGDVWTFKVWYVGADGKSRSKSVPSVGENSQPYYAEWIYLMIGSPYDAAQTAGSGTSKTLEAPVSVTITPPHIVDGSTIIANAKGGNGDGYAYQWYYRSGSSDASAWVAASGQTLPYWQKASGSVSVDDSQLTVTGFSDDDYNGEYYNLRNYGLNLWVLYDDLANRYSTKQSTWKAVLGYNTTLKAWIISRADDKLPSAVSVLANALAYCVTANATPYTSDGKSLTWTGGTEENPPSAVPQTTSASNIGMTPAGFASYVLAPNDALYCQVWSVDTQGNKSAQAATSNIAFVSNDTATGDGIFYRYEPDDRWQDANLIAPKGNWFSLVDSAIQRHVIGDSNDLGAYDHDWVYFVVPDDGKSAKKLVSFETNAGTMFQRGVKPSTSNYPNTALTVYKLENNKIREQFTVSRFSANDNTGDGTEMARFFQREMAPGIYYVDVWSESEGTRDMGAAYYMHLLIEDQVGVDEPYWSAGSGSLSAELTPYLPSADEDLQVTLNCKAYSASGKELKRFFYLWYCNGAIVPFTGKHDITEYTAGTYIYSCAVEGKDTVSSAQTKDGDVWMCQVYAYDPDYGFTAPITSNAVIIGGSVNFSMSFTPNKVYNYGTPAVEYGEEVVTIGWTPEVTFGFDLGLDEAAPSRTIPNGDGTYTRIPLERGSTYTLGLSNNAPYLLKDIRPYNEISSWFVVVEMGLPNNDDIAACSLAWNANSLPVDGTGVLNITQMNKRADGFFEPIAGTTVTVSAADMDESGTYSGVITLSEGQMAALQTDENGQKFAVFRVTVGTPSDMQTISLKKGWNLVALSVAPVNANVSDVFSDGGVRFYNGSVWQYENGKYVEATTLEAGRGYWLYSRVDRDGINIMGAAADTAISLKQGWNIFGPIYKIDDFVATYKTAYPQIYDAIEKVPGTEDQLELYKFDVTTGGYSLATDSSGKYVLTPGVGYWIKVKEAIQLPVVNK